MKFKVVANEIVMIEDCSAQKAMNMICGIFQGADGPVRIQIYYKAGNDTVGYCWKLENSFLAGPANL